MLHIAIQIHLIQDNTVRIAVVGGDGRTLCHFNRRNTSIATSSIINSEYYRRRTSCPLAVGFCTHAYFVIWAWICRYCKTTIWRSKIKFNFCHNTLRRNCYGIASIATYSCSIIIIFWRIVVVWSLCKYSCSGTIDIYSSYSSFICIT